MLSRQVIHFCLVGGCGFAIEAIVLQAMLAAGYGPLVARFVGFPLAVSVTWLLHRRFTFAARRSKQRGRELGRYFAAQIASVVLGLAIYTALILFSEWFHNWPLAALVVSAAVSTVSNFLLSRFVVFNNDPSVAAP